MNLMFYFFPVNATRTREPSISRPPQNITAQLVQSINLTCEAESYPSPIYKWYKDGQLIPGETLPYLFIPEVSPEDRGSYSCEASNTGGQISSNLAQIAIPGTYFLSNVNTCVDYLLIV